MEKAEAGIHHAEPLIVPREVCRERANRFSKPFLDSRVVNVVVIDPILVPGIVRWINEDAFDFTSVVG